MYRLPDGSRSRRAMRRCPSRRTMRTAAMVPSVFHIRHGRDRAWRDIDFDEAERKFAAAARRAAAFREGRPKLMQDEARRAAIRETRHRVCTAPILKSIKEDSQVTGKNVYTMTAMTRRAFVGLAVMAAQAGPAGCVRNGLDARLLTAARREVGRCRHLVAVRAAAVRPGVRGRHLDRPRGRSREVTGPDGKPFRYIRVAYTFENVTDSGRCRNPIPDINAYQDGISLDRSYKVQDQRAQKQIEPGGKLKSFTAFAPRF